MKRFCLLALASMMTLSNAFATTLSINNLSDQDMVAQYIWTTHDGTDIPQQAIINAHYNVNLGEGVKAYASISLQQASVNFDILQCSGVELFKKYANISLTVFPNFDCKATVTPSDKA